jgi:FKBP-type peptidyl-prolyl cis-trans isomerase
MASLAMIVLTGCTKPYKKAKDGSEYKIIENTNGKKAVAGDFLQADILVKYKDSVVYSTKEMGSPSFIPYDTARLPEFFKTVHEGDSLILRISTDTLFKKQQNEPYMKKGQFLYQYVKISKVYNTREQVDSAAKTYKASAKAASHKKMLEQIEKQLKDNADQLKKDDATITQYLSKNNLQATKTKWGTYVVITTPGTGPALTENDIVSVNYTGRNLKDSVFDSNTDPRFGHVEPYDVNLGEFGVIPGWIDGLKAMQKGAVGKLIIPSSLAYGKQARGENIGADEILVFDIAIVDVISPEQFEAKQQARQQEMMQKQQKAMEEAMKKQGKKETADTTKPASKK